MQFTFLDKLLPALTFHGDSNSLLVEINTGVCPHADSLMVGIYGCFEVSSGLLAAQFPDMGAGLCECGNCGS